MNDGFHMPVVRYHIERDAKFLCDDKHADEDWWGEWGDAFVCGWDSVTAAYDYLLSVAWSGDGTRIRVSVDDVLVPHVGAP